MLRKRLINTLLHNLNLKATTTWGQRYRREEYEFHLEGLHHYNIHRHSQRDKETTRAQMLVSGREKVLTETNLFAETAIRAY